MRSLANPLISGHFKILIGLVFFGVAIAEVFYFHVFDLGGFLQDVLSLKDSSGSWWTDERKVVWLLGCLLGAFLSLEVVIRRH